MPGSRSVALVDPPEIVGDSLTTRLAERGRVARVTSRALTALLPHVERAGGRAVDLAAALVTVLTAGPNRRARNVRPTTEGA